VRLALLCLLLTGCAPFRGDSPPVVKPCQIRVRDYDRRTETCVSREEWNRYWKPVLAPED